MRQRRPLVDVLGRYGAALAGASSRRSITERDVQAVCDLAAQTGLDALEGVGIIDTGYEDLNAVITFHGRRWVVKLFDARRPADDCARYVADITLAIEAGVRHPALRTSTFDGAALLRSETPDGERWGCVLDYVDHPSLFERGDQLSTDELDDLLRQVGRLARCTSDAPLRPDPWSALELHHQLQRDELPAGRIREMASVVASCFDMDLVAQLPTGLVHADLVPTNLLCSGEGTVSVIDFGRAGTMPLVHELAVIATHSIDLPGSADAHRDLDHVLALAGRDRDLTGAERAILPIYVAAVAASCMVEAETQRLAGDRTDENRYWLDRGIAVCELALTRFDLSPGATIT